LAAKLADDHSDTYWDIRNGYSFSSDERLQELNRKLARLSPAERDTLIATIKVGVHDDVGVTFSSRFNEVDTQGHSANPLLVTQCYCSALSCRYAGGSLEDWRPLATLVLDAAYEATLLAAILNAIRGGSNKVFLTFLGGGVFGNEKQWIANAIGRAIALISKKRWGDTLDVRVCHYRNIDQDMVSKIDYAYQQHMQALS